MEYVEANDVKFVRLVFCDLRGTPKNIAIMADYLPRVFEQGVGFDTSVLGCSSYEEGYDLLLHPDPATFAVLPWRPQSGRAARMYCDIFEQNDMLFLGNGRGFLRSMMQRLQNKGLSVKVGCECGFYLFERDENEIPALEPCDRAGYLDIAPMDKCENIRRDICLTLEELGSAPIGSYHERGPGQNSIWRRPTDLLTCADDIVTYKTVVRTLAVQHGLCATFMPRPLSEEHTSSLALSLTLEYSYDSEDAKTLVPDELSRAFHSGIARRLAEMTLFLRPSVNAYGCIDGTRAFEFSRENYHGAQFANFSPETHLSTIDLDIRSSQLGELDPLCNPYYALSLLVAAGLEGIEDSNPMHETKDTGEDDPQLPSDLGEALKRAQRSSFINSILPRCTLDSIFAAKRAEWNDYTCSEDKTRFEMLRYFEQI